MTHEYSFQVIYIQRKMKKRIWIEARFSERFFKNDCIQPYVFFSSAEFSTILLSKKIIENNLVPRRTYLKNKLVSRRDSNFLGFDKRAKLLYSHCIIPTVRYLLYFRLNRIVVCENRARICKRLRSPGIDFKESIPPAHVAWRTGTSNRFVVPFCMPGWESIPGLFRRFTNSG